MANLLENPGTRVILSFVLSLVIIYAFGKKVGEENKVKWFKKREKYSFFNRRGILGETLHFGHPITKQGYYVMLAMYGAIIAISYIIIFLL